jgi:hypothetical protein
LSASLLFVVLVGVARVDEDVRHGVGDRDLDRQEASMDFVCGPGRFEDLAVGSVEDLGELVDLPARVADARLRAGASEVVAAHERDVHLAVGAAVAGIADVDDEPASEGARDDVLARIEHPIVVPAVPAELEDRYGHRREDAVRRGCRSAPMSLRGGSSARLGRPLVARCGCVRRGVRRSRSRFVGGWS